MSDCACASDILASSEWIDSENHFQHGDSAADLILQHPERSEDSLIHSYDFVKTHHTRKSSRPKKIPMHFEAAVGNVLPDFTEAGKDKSTIESLMISDAQPEAEGQRRKSLRPRRKVQRSEAFQDEAALDQLLSDETNLTAYGPAQHWETGAGDYLTDDWFSVEKIMSHRTLPKRKLTKFILEAIKSYSASQLKMVQLEYFVKFHGRSYWNCAWISGAVLYAIHPSIVRNYIRSKGIFRVDIEVEWKPQEIESLDFADKRPVPPANHPSLEEPSGSKSLPVTKIEESSAADSKSNSSSSITIQHTSEEEIDNEDSLDQWTEAHTENIQKWVSSKVENVGSRRRYLIRWGVEREQLIPEQIISIGDAVNPTFDGTGDADSYLTNKETSKALQSIGYREVLVAWFHLPRNQATWEIVEEDLEALDSIALHLSRAPGLTVRDSTGRKLLPLTVRRHLIQLTNNYCTRIARMLCDAYSSYATIGKRPGPNSESWDGECLSGLTHHLLEHCRKPFARTGLTRITQWAPRGCSANQPHRRLFSLRAGCHHLPDFDCDNIWKDGQPSYLSPSEHAALHPYQVEGVRWLWHAFHNHVNAILADEMGLGKTVQVIALLYLLWKERNDYGPFLIVAPLSTLLNWEREFNVWAPDFHVIVYSGERSVRTAFQDYEFRIPNSGGVPAFHVLITSHELACIERSCLQSFDWSVLVVDEAHRLKNKQSRLFKEASQYKASFKILLTGTPLQNNLEELFHLLYFVEPKTVTDFKTLTEKWAQMPKEERINSLHCQLKNHLLRRLKADVIRDLPKKSEISVMVDMSVLQRKLYKLVLTKNYEELRCGSLMNSLVHLQKVCNHPYLLPVGDAIAPRVVSDTADACYEPKALVQVSGKMIVLMEMLRGLRERGHRVLVYSRMTTMLDILEEALTNEGYAFERIDGRVKGPLRQIAIDRFNARDCETFIFLLSTRAGGEGINLASADTVILYDSDWNPQCDLQALSRAHRIGQSRHVLVYRFITRHSLEERINLVARRKLALTNLVVNQRQQRIQKRLARQSTQESALDPNSSTSEEPADRCATSAPQVLDDGSCSKEDTRSSLPPITSTSNRLSRAEMDDMLRCGLETLFAVEDLLDVNDLQNAARSSDNPEHIVYDAQAISRLLDRSKIEADSDDPKSVADEYLSVFRVAHFGTPSEDKGQDISGIEPDDGSSATADHSASAPFVEVAEDKARPAKDTLGYAAFWDRLLRERHERLCNAEAEAVSENPRRVSKASWRLLQRTTLNSPIGSDDEVVIECEDSSSKGHSSSAIGPISGNLSSRISDTSAENSSVNEDGCNRPSKSTNRQRNSHRSLKSKRTKAARHSTSHGASKRDRACESRATDEDTFIASDNSQVSDELNDSDVDPSYVPSNEDSDDARLDASLVAKWQRRNRNRTDHEFLEISDSDETDSPLSIEELTAFGNICNDTGTAAFWHPIPEVCAKWREAADSSGPKIEWANDCMFIHGFGPEDRQSFANAVMRFGLPPPGVIPPQDWLPPNLLFKDPARLHAYSTLFMQHLFEDPNAMDDSTEYWSDGLPKEQLCASAVLARIGMMALIRNKVLQFEDINGVHSRTFEAVSTRFKFNIHEGGLTLLRPTWYDEWQRINALVEKIAPSSDGTDFAMKKRSEAMYYLQHTWHSRHDYWLLAAIHVHGYFRWADILADPRFHLLNTGLEGVLADMEGQTQPTGGDSQKHQINMAEAQAFLVNRLRLLEHALLVEQALHEIAQAALEGSSGKKSPPLTRVQNLVVCLSNKLAAAGPRKRIALPRDERARSATRAAVERLQEILEDIYADLPGLPASVLCAEAEPASTSEQAETTTTQPSNASSEMSHKEATTSLDSAPETAAHTSSPSPSGAPSDVTSDVPAPSPTHATDSVKPPPPSPDKMTVIEISDSES